MAAARLQHGCGNALTAWVWQRRHRLKPASDRKSALKRTGGSRFCTVSTVWDGAAVVFRCRQLVLSQATCRGERTQQRMRGNSGFGGDALTTAWVWQRRHRLKPASDRKSALKRTGGSRFCTVSTAWDGAAVVFRCRQLVLSQATCRGERTQQRMRGNSGFGGDALTIWVWQRAYSMGMATSPPVETGV